MYSLSRPRLVARLLSKWKRACTPPARPQGYRPTLESLEDRLVMAGTFAPPPLPPPSQNGPVATDSSVAYHFDHAAPIIGHTYGKQTHPNPGATSGRITIRISLDPIALLIAPPRGLRSNILTNTITIPATGDLSPRWLRFDRSSRRASRKRIGSTRDRR